MQAITRAAKLCRSRTLRGIPSAYKSGNAFATTTLRFYSSNSAQSRRKDEAPSFKKIFLIGIIGTVIFVEAVRSLDKNKPKTTYSEQEFADVMSGLRRRVAAFPAGQLDVKFILTGNKKDVEKLVDQYDLLIDPIEVVEHYRSSTNDSYEALLNDLYDRYGAQKYSQNLPKGLLVMLIGRYMKEKCLPNSTVVIINFPSNIQDSIKFENEVSVVSKIYVPHASMGSEVCKYYQTVKKV